MIILTMKPKRRINLNTLAREVAEREGGKVNLKIAQISEAQRHVIDLLALEFNRNPRGVVELFAKRVKDLRRA